MNKERLLSRVAFWSAAVLTLAAACLRTAAFFTAYDGEIGYFNRSAVTTVYRILGTCCVFISSMCGMLIPKDKLSAPSASRGRSPAAAFPLAASLLAAFSFLLDYSGMSVLRILCILLSLCAAMHFLLALFGTGSRNLRGMLGFSVILLCMLIIGLTYNDPYVTMNSPVKLAVQFSCVGIMLGMTADLRRLLGKPAPRLALPVLSAALFFCAAGAMPCLAARIAGFIPAGRPEGGSQYLAYLCFSSLMGVYLLIRFVQGVFRTADASDTASAVDDEGTADNPPQQE